ncbi:uncharacterized protein [Paramisgurnus dabryanus]|uniref:uncharacterized protein n=1 Tax=Paramisgurnus dabryanus TaxID=90735 RepID=UPI003CCF7ED5
MATGSSNEFQLVFPVTSQRTSAHVVIGFNISCHLSPETSAVDMEIRWFKETDCVCICKNRQMIEGRGYEGRVRRFTEVLERGNVSLSLKGFKWSDVGNYVCQVITGNRTQEITVEVKGLERPTLISGLVAVSELSFGVCRLCLEEINRTWTEEERLKMEDSALLAELTEKSKNTEDLKSFITERDTKIKCLEEFKESLLTERNKLIQEKDNILLESKQKRDKELEISKHQVETLRNELQEMKMQLDEQKTKFTHQEKTLHEHKQQQKQYDQTIKNLHSQIERVKNESSTQFAEFNKKCKRLEDTEKLLSERDAQIKDLEKSKETALEEKKKLLNISNDKLIQTTREIKEKAKLMSEKERLLENTVKDLETSKHQLETLRNELKDKNRQIQLLLEKNKLLKSSAGIETSVSTALVRRRNSIDFIPPTISGETASILVPGSELRLVLLGSAGSEKSASVNIILNREEKIQTDTSTEIQQSESRQGEVNGKQVTVVETPDWFCSGLSLEEVRQDVRLCVRLSAPGPHAFLLIIPVQQSTGVERAMLEKMEEIFAERCWRNTMILFTVTDEEQKKIIEDFVQSGNQEVQRLVEKCGNRFHCLNIHQSGDDSQISELLEKIEKMMEGNTERFYSSEIYLEIESQIRAMERKIIRDTWERKERDEREINEKIEKEVQRSLRKIEGAIEEHEGDIKQLNERTGELERQMREEKDDEKKKGLKRELEKEVEKRTKLELKIKILKDQKEREKSEMKEKHRQEMEEIRQMYEGEMRVETERNLMKIILPELKRNILESKSKMQEEFNRQMEEKNREIETLKNQFSELKENYSIVWDLYESAMKKNLQE